MAEFLWKLLASAILTLLIKGGVAMFDHWIAWWLAAAIALVLVFGGWLIITNLDEGWD
ncbi:hypothetical protein ABZ949_02580 [Micromonospora tulbaghiae]|uniref:hypothetical protein n=1 Tax=Micromonospora tulbaghiae TaxID=479978 RepID=UPI003405D9AF